MCGVPGGMTSVPLDFCSIRRTRHLTRMPLPRRPQIGVPTRPDAIQQSPDHVLAEEGDTKTIFTNPSDPKTQAYITGRFG